MSVRPGGDAHFTESVYAPTKRLKPLFVSRRRFGTKKGTINTLKEWKAACPKGPDGLAFPTGTGAAEYHVNIVNRGLIPAWRAAGITDRYSGLHALRHFHASWLINRKEDGGLGLPPKIVQERLGHSTISMTIDTYGHLFPQDGAHEEMAAAEKSLLD